MLAQIHDVVRRRNRVTIPTCPGCRKPMAFKGKKHILFTNGLGDATYRCEICKLETKRTVKFP